MENKDLKNGSNVLEKNFEDKIVETLNQISGIVSNSLGYYGHTTIIEDKFMGHIITKDGFTILKKIKFLTDPFKATILDLIKNISMDLVSEVGDGSTSSIVIATEIYKNILKCKKDPNDIISTLPDKEILNQLKELEKIISDEIKNIAIPLDAKDFDKVKNIAKVSLNNDEEIANLIAKIYEEIGNDGHITIDLSSTKNSHYERLEGFELSRGYVTNKCANQPNRKECILENPKILLCNDTLGEEDINVIFDVLGTLASNLEPLVIISKNFSNYFIDLVNKNFSMNDHLQLLLVDQSFASTNSREGFDDLAICLGAKVLDKYDFNENNPMTSKLILNEYLGSCDKIISSETTTQIIGFNGDKDKINKRIEYLEFLKDELRKKADKIDIEKDIILLNNRKAFMTGGMARVFVGGETEKEKETNKYLVEDAVYACKSAIKHGYVAGTNLNVPKVINTIKEKSNSEEFDDFILSLSQLHLLDSISKSFEETFKIMMRNSNLFPNEKELEKCKDRCINTNHIYNLKTNDYESDYETVIINSTMTDIRILESSLSIIGLIVTSDQFIYN